MSGFAGFEMESQARDIPWGLHDWYVLPGGNDHAG